MSSKAQRGFSRTSNASTDTNLSPATLASRFAAPASPSEPSHRPRFPEAVALYETGVRAFQQHRFPEAVQAFRGVLTQYPEEKELNERVRVYLSACERQLATNSEPQNQEQRLYAATLAMNAGDIDCALRHLQ